MIEIYLKFLQQLILLAIYLFTSTISIQYIYQRERIDAARYFAIAIFICMVLFQDNKIVIIVAYLTLISARNFIDWISITKEELIQTESEKTFKLRKPRIVTKRASPLWRRKTVVRATTEASQLVLLILSILFHLPTTIKNPQTEQ